MAYEFQDAIPFKQFLYPNGQERQVSVVRPLEIMKKAEKIIHNGYEFQCEVLSTGEVSFTISDEDGDHAIEIVENGPGVPEAVDRLVNKFFNKMNGI